MIIKQELVWAKSGRWVAYPGWWWSWVTYHENNDKNGKSLFIAFKFF